MHFLLFLFGKRRTCGIYNFLFGVLQRAFDGTASRRGMPPAAKQRTQFTRIITVGRAKRNLVCTVAPLSQGNSDANTLYLPRKRRKAL